MYYCVAFVNIVFWYKQLIANSELQCEYIQCMIWNWSRPTNDLLRHCRNPRRDAQRMRASLELATWFVESISLQVGYTVSSLFIGRNGLTLLTFLLSRLGGLIRVSAVNAEDVFTYRSVWLYQLNDLYLVYFVVNKNVSTGKLKYLCSGAAQFGHVHR